MTTVVSWNEESGWTVAFVSAECVGEYILKAARREKKAGFEMREHVTFKSSRRNRS